MAHSEKSLVSVFQEFSASINKALILAWGGGGGGGGAGCWTIILWGLDTFLIFLHVQLMRQLIYITLISNNRASLHLW